MEGKAAWDDQLTYAAMMSRELVMLAKAQAAAGTTPDVGEFARQLEELIWACIVMNGEDEDPTYTERDQDIADEERAYQVAAHVLARHPALRERYDLRDIAQRAGSGLSLRRAGGTVN